MLTRSTACGELAGATGTAAERLNALGAVGDERADEGVAVVMWITSPSSTTRRVAPVPAAADSGSPRSGTRVRRCGSLCAGSCGAGSWVLEWCSRGLTPQRGAVVCRGRARSRACSARRG